MNIPFNEKNADRRLAKGVAGSLKRRAYLDARYLRRHCTIGGAFGYAMPEHWHDRLVAGTLGQPRGTGVSS